jgi:excisionase family DNA binding protein
MLTTREVSELLNLHINTVRRWSNQGILKTYRIGPRGDRRFRQSDVYNLLIKKPEHIKQRDFVKPKD